MIREIDELRAERDALRVRCNELSIEIDRLKHQHDNLEFECSLLPRSVRPLGSSHYWDS